MELKLGQESIIFIEESTLLSPGFIEYFKEFLVPSSNGTLVEGIMNFSSQKRTYLLDKNVRSTIDNMKMMKQYRDAYLLEGFIDILETFYTTEFIETKNYFDGSKLTSYFKKNKSNQSIVLTQKETIFQNLKDMQSHIPSIVYAQYRNNVLETWVIGSKKSKQAFYIKKDTYVNRVDDTKLTHAYSPKFGYMKLDKTKVFTGGEGSIYRTYNQLMCKIYNQSHMTYTNFKKLSLMLEMDIHNPFINWPKDIIYHQNDFVGYLMDEIEGATPLDELRIDGFQTYPVIERYIIAYNFVKNVHYLHMKNIVVGDMKLDNILVKSASEVYLIDCGSYQISDYPCTVYHPDYTKQTYTPEELKKNLRVVEDEYYAINKIMFEILIGKYPNFNRTNTEIDETDKFGFHYPIDLSGIDLKTAPTDLKLWGVMSQKMRDMFYYYFKEGKVSYLPEWIDEFKLFIDSIFQMNNQTQRS